MRNKRIEGGKHFLSTIEVGQTIVYDGPYRCRSGCSLRGIEVVNPLKIEVVNPLTEESRYIDADVKIGLIDSNYRKNCGTIMQVREVFGVGERWFIKKGSRISQMRIVDVPEVELIEAEELSETERDGGFGSTGVR